MSEQTPTTRPRDSIPQGKVTIELEAAGIGAPVVCRVRRLLKAALRAYGLRCVRCEFPGVGEPVDKVGGAE